MRYAFKQNQIDAAIQTLSSKTGLTWKWSELFRSHDHGIVFHIDGLANPENPHEWHNTDRFKQQLSELGIEFRLDNLTASLNYLRAEFSDPLKIHALSQGRTSSEALTEQEIQAAIHNLNAKTKLEWKYDEREKAIVYIKKPLDTYGSWEDKQAAFAETLKNEGIEFNLNIRAGRGQLKAAFSEPETIRALARNQFTYNEVITAHSQQTQVSFAAAAATSVLNRVENMQVAAYLTQKTRMQWQCNEAGEVVHTDRVRVSDGLSREERIAEATRLVKEYEDALEHQIASFGLRFVPDTVTPGGRTERSGGNTMEVIATYSTPEELHELFLQSQHEAAHSSVPSVEDLVIIRIDASKYIRFEEIDTRIIKKTDWLERSPMSCDIEVPRNSAQEIIAKLQMTDGVLMIRPEQGAAIQTTAGKQDQEERQKQSAMLTDNQSFLGKAAAAAFQTAPSVTTVAQLEKAYRDHAGFFNAASKIFGDKPDFETAIGRLQTRFQDSKHNREEKGATYEALKAAGRLPPAPEEKVTPRR